MAFKSRRRFMSEAGAYLAIAGTGVSAPLSSLMAASFKSNPFTLGVASGDPAPDGFVIWTRLAPGIPGAFELLQAPVEVAYEVADSATFNHIVRKGTTTAAADAAHSLHVEIAGLEAGREYYYRFIAGGIQSPAGRAKTLPAAGATVQQFRFGVAGCQRYESGLYTAYRHLAQENLDLVFHYGDYIYETLRKKPWKTRPLVRRVPLALKKVKTLDEYRALYACYKSDPNLQAAHASAPFVPSFDDHEVENDWTGQFSKDQSAPAPSAAFLARRQAAFQAWYEHMPLRAAQRPSGANVQAFRKLRIGRLASMNVLDTRQYRTAWPCQEKWAACAAAGEDHRTLLGQRQEAWLFDLLRRSDTAWNILAQQVFMMRYDRDPDPAIVVTNMDKWDGAVAGRERLFKTISEGKVTGVVMLTGDVHDNWAGDLKRNFDDPASETLGVEFVATSISSGGDGNDGAKRLAKIRSGNPHIKYFNKQRGYVRHTVGQDTWRADFRVVERVTVPGAPIRTAKSMVSERRRPGVQEA